MDIRPTLHATDTDAAARAAAEEFAAGLGKAMQENSADVYDAAFAEDILWGSPYGATVDGYPTLNAIHRRLHTEHAAPPSRFEVVSARHPAPGILITQIRRQAIDPEGFSEMAMYVLVERDGRWWLAAGQNTSVRAR
ncbi:DUF4440 domain-containing protein [Nocardia sp. alder85J]|uniref:DUF4440 domain-containing protein n=1 Tax=Nocardia sp. alder85J TaxID=2862949 RepID=UPI001CD2F3AB|nr:DUF4440 domain-containing protein [Nocardia sp. alder85J]MCX4097591.1 DUF4440 domain-containing protein [Nocardia sp. alder85J]